MNDVRVAYAAANALGEGVVWDAREQVVYWTDIDRCTLSRFDPASKRATHWSLPERLGSIALCETPGRLLLALASRLAFFEIATQRLFPIAAIEPGLPTRANDGACDRQGRFVFGTLHEPTTGARQPLGGFYRLGADLRLERLPLPDVTVANSIAFSPSGDRMYFCDSPGKRIFCCDYGDLIGEPRLFADLSDAPGEPDGSAVDSEGALWNAQWDAGRIVCYLPDGRPARAIELPARRATRPAFGGPGLDALYVTSARRGLSDAQLAREPDSGALFIVDAPVSGLPEPRFQGLPRRHT